MIRLLPEMIDVEDSNEIIILPPVGVMPYGYFYRCVIPKTCVCIDRVDGTRYIIPPIFRGDQYRFKFTPMLDPVRPRMNRFYFTEIELLSMYDAYGIQAKGDEPSIYSIDTD